MRILTALGLALAFLATPAHAAGRNTGTFHGSQDYESGACTTSSCDTSFSIDFAYAGPDGAGRLHCNFAGAAAFDGTTEQATLSGECAGVSLGVRCFPDSTLSYLKTGLQFSGHLEWTVDGVTWAAGLSGFAVAQPQPGVTLAGTASVYVL